MSGINSETYHNWGTQVAEAFLKADAPMNHGIAKLASDNELSPTQIKRVCEIANQKSYSGIFSVNPDRAMNYDIASCGGVQEELNKAAASQPASLDYSSAPELGKVAFSRSKIMASFGVKSVSNEHEKEETRKIASKYINRLKVVKSEIHSRQLENELNKNASEERFFNICKQMVLKGDSFQKIADVAMATNHDERVSPQMMNDLVTKTDNRLKSIGAISKKQDLVIGSPMLEALKDQGVPKDVGGEKVLFNYHHPLIQEVNTISNVAKERDILEAAYGDAEQKIQALTTGVEKYDHGMEIDKYDYEGQNLNAS